MIVLAFWGSIFPVILFNIDRKKIIWAGICGALGWIAYSIVCERTGSSVAGSFFGAFVVNMYSEFMARRIKTPASMFYVPGIFPLVPGIIAYNTIRYIVEHNYDNAISKGILTMAICGAIAFGIMLSATIVKFVERVSKKMKQSFYNIQ